MAQIVIDTWLKELLIYGSNCHWYMTWKNYWCIIHIVIKIWLKELLIYDSNRHWHMAQRVMNIWLKSSLIHDLEKLLMHNSHRHSNMTWRVINIWSNRHWYMIQKNYWYIIFVVINTWTKLLKHNQTVIHSWLKK